MASRIAWLPLVALMAASQAWAAAPNQQQNQRASNSPFPPNQPTKPYAVMGGTNGTQGAFRAGGYEPNAGQTGLQGSGGTNYGWVGTAPGNRNGQ